MVMWRRRDAAFSRAIVCAGWVVVSVLPVFSFFHVSATLEGSRYLYLPAAGFALLVALLLGEAARSMPRRFTPVLIAAGVMVLAIQSVTASRFEVARWTEAAALRDRILTDYVRVMPSGSCGAIAAEGVVDNVDGAYVLRNGFAQALAEMGAEASESAAPRCRVSWTDHLVVTQEP
jgi:4-amino-4-deoxy-L-arabinose transferase-like glycosyltransferase